MRLLVINALSSEFPRDMHDREVVRAAQAASERVLQTVREHPDDADYDRRPT